MTIQWVTNTDIAFNEIINSSFENAQKPTAHTGSCENVQWMDSEVSVADSKQYQRTNNSQL